METPGTLRVLAADAPAPAQSHFRMIDVGEKKDTQRRAVASGRFFADPATIMRIRERTLPKGDVLVLAEIAGIQGAKNVSGLLPLCHPLSLTSVRVWTEVETDGVGVFCEAKTLGKTGVEMEALAGVSAALLCLYDLTKGVDPVLKVGEIRLELKEGGKSGIWRHPETYSERHSETPVRHDARSLSLHQVETAVFTLSDRCARGEQEDVAGSVAATWLRDRGACVASSIVLPDERDALRRELGQLLERSSVRLIVTTGGTGLSPRDITPETVLDWAHGLGGREIPGFGELMRKAGETHTKSAWLSRMIGVVVKGVVILCLPGNPKAVVESLDAVDDLLSHALHMADAGGHEP